MANDLTKQLEGATAISFQNKGDCVIRLPGQDGAIVSVAPGGSGTLSVEYARKHPGLLSDYAGLGAVFKFTHADSEEPEKTKKK